MMILSIFNIFSKIRIFSLVRNIVICPTIYTRQKEFATLCKFTKLLAFVVDFLLSGTTLSRSPTAVTDSVESN